VVCFRYLDSLVFVVIIDLRLFSSCVRYWVI